MNRTSAKRIEKLQATLSPLAIKAGQACEDLILHLRAAGPRGKWSSHEKMAYEHKFGTAKACTDTLGAQLATLMPAHWEMNTYRLRLTRDGKSLRFCGKMGKAQGGIQVGTTVGDIQFLSGYLTGALTAGREYNPADGNRMKALDLTDKISYRFHFWGKHRQDQVNEYSGLTPRDACAYAHAAGHLFSRGTWSDLDGPEQAFTFGCSRARKCILGEMPRWSVMPTLWDVLTKDKNVKSLYRENTSYNAWDAPWKKRTDIETMETLVSGAIRLLPLIEKGTHKDWLVVTSSSGIERVKAWCPASALVKEFLTRTTPDHIPYNFAEWEVYPASSETGEQARAAMGIKVQKRPQTRRHEHRLERETLRDRWLQEAMDNDLPF